MEEDIDDDHAAVMTSVDANDNHQHVCETEPGEISFEDHQEELSMSSSDSEHHELSDSVTLDDTEAKTITMNDTESNTDPLEQDSMDAKTLGDTNITSNVLDDAAMDSSGMSFHSNQHSPMLGDALQTQDSASPVINDKFLFSQSDPILTANNSTDHLDSSSDDCHQSDEGSSVQSRVTYTPPPGSSRAVKRILRDMDQDVHHEALSSELRQGLRILTEFMSDANKSINWPFMDAVDGSLPGIEDYYDKVKEPMWLTKMLEKFRERQYKTITEFVADFRLMLENCFRYNGPDHTVSKKGQRMETVLEQKLALLNRDVREKTTIQATKGLTDDGIPLTGSRRRRALMPHDSSELLNELRRQEKEKERENRRQQTIQRKQAQESQYQQLLAWDTELLGRQGALYKHMYEIPQIGHFLFLSLSSLNLSEIMHWELERGIAMPRESSTMQRIMTSLLSTPYQRTKLDGKPLMPYKVWDQKLRLKLQIFYKTFRDCGKDTLKTFMKTGVEEKFFQVVGRKNPMRRQKYHELTYYQRVWILKALCDYCLETQESVRADIELQNSSDMMEYQLGTDANGYMYLHFPQFCGQDLRVYKQAPYKPPKTLPRDTPTNYNYMPPMVFEPPSKKKKKRKPPAPPSHHVPPTTGDSRGRDGRLRKNPKQMSSRYVDNESTDSSDSEDYIKYNTASALQIRLPHGIAKCHNYRSAKFNMLPGSSSGCPSPAGDNSETSDYGVSDESAAQTPSNTPNIQSNNSSRASSPHAATKCRRNRSKARSRRRGKRRVMKNKPKGGKPDVECLQKSLCDKEYEENACSQDVDPGMASAHPCNGDLSDTESEIDTSCMNTKNSDNDAEIVTDTREDENVKKKFHLMNGDVTKDTNGDRVVKENYGNGILDGACSSSEEDMIVLDVKQHGEEEEQDEEELNHNDDKHNGVMGKREEKVECNGQQQQCNGHEEKIDSGEQDQRERMDPGEEEKREMMDAEEEDKREKMDAEEEDKREKMDIEEEEKREKMCAEATEKREMDSEEEEKGDKMDAEEKEKVEKMDTEEEEKKEKIIYDENVQDDALKVDRDDKAALSEVEEELSTKDTKEEVGIVKDEMIDNTLIKTEEKCENQEGIIVSCDVKEEQQSNEAKSPTENNSEIKIKDEKDMDEHNKTMVKEEDKAEDKDEIKIESKEIKQEVKSDDDSEESEAEIQDPDPKDFELLANSVEDLKQLCSEFRSQLATPLKKRSKAEASPKGRKSVGELLERLEELLKELDPWEFKLQQANKKARMKMCKEKEMYKEEAEPQEDVWESEESKSDASDDESSKRPAPEVVTKAATEELYTMRLRARPPKKDFSEYSVDSDSNVTQPAPVEEFEISSRGRIRKRRIIPNNVEDQGIKRRRIMRDVSPSSAQNIQRTSRRTATRSPVPFTDAQQDKHNALTTAQLLQHLQTQQKQHGGAPTTLSVFTSGGQTFLITAPIQGHKQIVLQSPPSGSVPGGITSVSTVGEKVRLTGVATQLPAGVGLSDKHRMSHLRIHRPQKTLTATSLPCAIGQEKLTSTVLPTRPVTPSKVTSIRQSGVATAGISSPVKGLALLANPVKGMVQIGNSVKGLVPANTQVKTVHPSLQARLAAPVMQTPSHIRHPVTMLSTAASNSVQQKNVRQKSVQGVIKQQSDTGVGAVVNSVTPVVTSVVTPAIPVVTPAVPLVNPGTLLPRQHLILPTVIQNNGQQLNLTNVPRNVLQQLINSQTIQQVNRTTMALTTLSTQAVGAQSTDTPAIINIPQIQHRPVISPNQIVTQLKPIQRMPHMAVPTVTTLPLVQNVTSSSVLGGSSLQTPLAGGQPTTVSITSVSPRMITPQLASPVKGTGNVMVQLKTEPMSTIDTFIGDRKHKAKYANNITVKELLEVRANSKTDPSNVNNVLQAKVDAMIQPMTDVTKMKSLSKESLSDLPEADNPGIPSIPHQKVTLKPEISSIECVKQTMKTEVNVPSNLDEAMKLVITTIPTTLPTMNVKFTGLPASSTRSVTVNTPAVTTPLLAQPTLQSISVPTGMQSTVTPSVQIPGVAYQHVLSNSGQAVRLIRLSTPQNKISTPVNIMPRPAGKTGAHAGNSTTNPALPISMIGQPKIANEATLGSPVGNQLTVVRPVAASTHIPTGLAMMSPSTVPRLSPTIRAIPSQSASDLINVVRAQQVATRPSQQELEEIAIHTLTSGFQQSSKSDDLKCKTDPTDSQSVSATGNSHVLTSSQQSLGSVSTTNNPAVLPSPTPIAPTRQLLASPNTSLSVPQPIPQPIPQVMPVQPPGGMGTPAITPVTSAGQKHVLLRLAVPAGTNLDQLLQTSQMQTLQQQLSTQMKAQKAKIVEDTTASPKKSTTLPFNRVQPIPTALMPNRPTLATKVVLPVSNQVFQPRIVRTIQRVQQAPGSASITVGRPTWSQSDNITVDDVPKTTGAVASSVDDAGVVSSKTYTRPITVAQLCKLRVQQQKESSQVTSTTVSTAQGIARPITAPIVMTTVSSSTPNRIVVYNVPQHPTPMTIASQVQLRTARPSPYIIQNGGAGVRLQVPVIQKPVAMTRMVGMQGAVRTAILGGSHTIVHNASSAVNAVTPVIVKEQHDPVVKSEHVEKMNEQVEPPDAE